MSWFVLLLACGGSPSPGPAHGVDSADDPIQDDDAGDDGQDDTSAPAPVQPTLPLLSEAPDLDPADGVVHVSLTAAPKQHTIVNWRTGETREVEGYAYEGQTPGPVIRAVVGDTLIVDLDNQLGVPTTIHWHGVATPWAMDGVTWMADPVAAGGTFTYTFTVTQAGTFWYHPHFDTAHQVDHGLYGVLVVEDPAEPSVDRDLVLVLDDWGQLQEEEEEEEEDEHHGDSVEGWWTVNGVVDPAFPVTGGETLRLRLVNTSNHGYLDLSLVGARVLARDQGLLSRVETTAQEVLAPGDRVELEVRPGDADLALLDAPYSLNGGTALGDPEPRVHLTISDPTVPADPIEWPTQTEAPTLDPGRTDITWTFQGSIHGDNWMISGEQFPNVTIPQALLGDELIVEVRNLSATEHPFHLHGMHFEVLSINGEAPGSKTVEDTLNIPLYSAARLRVIADNPGDWMAHCHILPHAEGGMMTVLRVLEP